MQYENYINDVLDGKIITGELVKKAVRRFVYMRDNGQKHGFYFDPAAVRRVINFFRTLRHTSGDFGGKNFEPLPWQQFVLAGIFGFKYIETGKRVCTKAYIEVARKNGKSEFAGAFGNYLAFMDGEYGAQVFSAANTADQASVCWKAGAAMATRLRDESKTFADKTRIYNSTNNRIITSMVDGETFFKPVAANAHVLDGLRPHGTIVDEYHEAPDDSVLRVMESGMTNRSQPVLLIITTAGFNINGPCYQYRKTVVSILEGQKENWNTFGLIYCRDEKDNWHDESAWVKANPSMPNTPTLRGMRDAYQKAVTEGGGAEINFRTKNLNEWVTTKTRWLSDEIWMRNTLEALSDITLKWWAGLDLSTTRDLTALVLFSSKDSRGKHNIITFNFIPEDNARERARRDGVPYPDWANDGFIIMTPGNVIDYDFVYDFVYRTCKEYNVQQLLYDPFNATQIAIKMEVDGINCASISQNTKNFHEPIKYIETTASKGELAHGGNPVLRWMCQNIEIYRDTNGNQKFDKRGSDVNRIDGMVALGMAIAGYLNDQNTDSIYNTENRGLLTL